MIVRKRSSRTSGALVHNSDLDGMREARDRSEIYSLNPDQDDQIKQLIDEAGKEGDMQQAQRCACGRE